MIRRLFENTNRVCSNSSFGVRADKYPIDQIYQKQKGVNHVGKHGIQLLSRTNSFVSAGVVSLCVFWIGGIGGVLVDTDHILRCLGDISYRCISDHGSKVFHTWVGAGVYLLLGLVCAYLAGHRRVLSDNSDDQLP